MVLLEIATKGAYSIGAEGKDVRIGSEELPE
jgi:hypothetical protein